MSGHLISLYLNVCFWHKADIQDFLHPQYSIQTIRYIVINLVH
jgi:hypothetical protein